MSWAPTARAQAAGLHNKVLWGMAGGRAPEIELERYDEIVECRWRHEYQNSKQAEGDWFE